MFKLAVTIDDSHPFPTYTANEERDAFSVQLLIRAHAKLGTWGDLKPRLSGRAKV